MKTLLILFGMAVAASAALNVPLEVSNWSDAVRTGEPVAAGVPLPSGAVYDLTKLRITDASGNTVPAQFKALTRWWWEKNQGLTQTPSVKWVLCDFQANVAATNKTAFTLKDDNSSTPTTALALTQDANGVTIVTGPLKFTVSKQHFNLFDELFLDANNNTTFETGEKIIASSMNNGGFITAGSWAAGGAVDNTVHSSALNAPDRVLIEEQGPMKIVLRVEGRHYAAANGVAKGLYGYQVFITAYAGKPYVDVQWAVTNTYMEGDKPGETGTSKPYQVYVWPFKDYKLVLNLTLGASQNYSILGASEVTGAAGASPVRLLQQAGNYTLTGAAGGSVALGAASLSDGAVGVVTALRDFAPNNPKGLTVEQNRLTWELFPNTGTNYGLDAYSRKNHRLRFEFVSGAVASGAVTALSKKVNAPLRMLASRDWYKASGAWYRGFGIPPSSEWNRKAPGSWTRMPKGAGTNWVTFGELGEFNGGGDHWNLTSAFWWPALTGNPAEFEDAESKALNFNDLVPVQLSWYDDPWKQLDFFLNAENHLSGLNSYHGPTNNNIYNGTLLAFPGYTEHRTNVPDDGHMPQLETLEYYELTGDLATLDALRSMGVRAIASIFGKCYFAQGRPFSSKVVLDSAFIMGPQQRYIARPGIVSQHAYEVTGDDRFLWPTSIAAYSLRNYTRQNPIGYMGKPDDRSYLPNTDAGVLAIWQVNHPSDTDFPRSFHANDFMIGIAEEALYGYVQTTRDEEIRDALIFSAKSKEWRAGMNGATYLGFDYSNWADYLQEGKRYHQSVQTGTGSFTSSMAEAFGGLIFGYLMSGRADLWKVIVDGTASFPAFYPSGNTLDLKVINLFEAYYKHDSLDITPPAAVGDLQGAFQSGTGVHLTWTAPGGDGATGTAKEYQVKFGPSPIVDIPSRWNAGTQTGWPDMRVPLPYNATDLLARASNYKKTREIAFWGADNAKGEPAPKAAGQAESFNVSGLKNNTPYYFAMVSFDSAGNVSDISNVVSLTTGIETAGRGETAFQFSNGPNPFNGVTRFRISGFGTGNYSSIRLAIYDSRGRMIRRFEPTRDSKPGTSFDLTWNGHDAHGAPLPAGLYFCRLEGAGKKFERKIVLLK